jgi:hypothetical protein
LSLPTRRNLTAIGNSPREKFWLKVLKDLQSCWQLWVYSFGVQFGLHLPGERNGFSFFDVTFCWFDLFSDFDPSISNLKVGEIYDN